MTTPPTDFADATRAAALDRLASFTPHMGRSYAAKRNFDLGPGAHLGVSTLSPYIRRRLILEQETVEAAVETHGATSAEKFVQEVIWRGYFKGWLERRPSVWAEYKSSLNRLHDQAFPTLQAAEAGKTGIDCFDAWAKELTETGYMHNHARMWFASIWIFTFKLPWQLGADFFLRHLLDGDPASNTLSWRWVAGLHTKGKAYIAQRWNIEKFTDGRFDLPPNTLNETAEPLTETFDAGHALALRDPAPFDAARSFALLITEDDCHIESLGLELSSAKALAALELPTARSSAAINPLIPAFDRAALSDAAQRAEAAGAPPAQTLTAPSPEELIDWAKSNGAEQIVTSYLPIGWTADWLDTARPHLAAHDIRLVEIRRDWDSTIWPYATAGFFKVKKAIPKILAKLAPDPQLELF